jgi:hypothetical protein
MRDDLIINKLPQARWSMEDEKTLRIYKPVTSCMDGLRDIAMRQGISKDKKWRVTYSKLRC